MKANNLSSRFFYFNPSSSDTTDARMFPMSHLTSLHINNGVGTGDEALAVTFEDSEVGDHTFILIYVTAGEGKKAMKNIVDAINSTQQIAVLADNSIKKSIISNVNWGTTPSIAEGDVGAFNLSGSLTAAGNITTATTLVAQGSFLLGYETQTSGALSPSKPVSFLNTTSGPAAFSLAATTYGGRTKKIVMSQDGGNGVLTITNPMGAANTYTFTDVGQSLSLVSGVIADGSVKWIVTGRESGAAQAADGVSGLPAATAV